MISRVLRGEKDALKQFFSGFKTTRKYLFDHTEADKIVRKLKDVQDSYVFEIQPGPCILAQAFLRNGCPKVYCQETSPHFKGVLDELENTYPGRFIARVGSYGEVGFDMIHTGENILHQDIKPIDWRSDKFSGRIVFSTPITSDNSFNMMYYWVQHVLFRSSLLAYGRCELLLVASEKVSERFLSNNTRSASTRLIRLLCDIKDFHTMNKSVFYPNIHAKSKSKIKVISFIPKKEPGLCVQEENLLNISPLIKLLYWRPAKPLSFHFKILVEDHDSFLKKVGLEQQMTPRRLTDDQLLALVNEYFRWECRNDFILNDHNLHNDYFETGFD